MMKASNDLYKTQFAIFSPLSERANYPIFMLIAVVALSLVYNVFYTPASQIYKLTFDNAQEHSVEFDSYDFSKANTFYRSLNLSFLSAIDKETLEQTILSHMEYPINIRAKKYLSSLLMHAQQRNLDPLWVISIAWTESHFNPNAQSYVKAQGLMQIMPQTGIFLHRLLKRSLNEEDIVKILRVPHVNMELGVYYLSRLYKRFKSYRLASVAYNMGPGFVNRRLRTNKPVGNKNIYYDKVKVNYKSLMAAVWTLNKKSRQLGRKSILLKKDSTIDLNYYLGYDIVPKIDKKLASKKKSGSQTKS